MDTQPQSYRPTKRTVIFAVICFLLVCAALLYVTVLRIPPSAYDSTLNDLQSLKSKASDLYNTLDTSSQSHAITQQYVTDLQTKLTSYTDLVTTISSSRAVQHDSKVKAAYSEHSSDLTKFSNAAAAALASEKAYLAIAKYCAQFETTAYLTIAGVISDDSRYTSDKTHCQDAITSVKRLSDNDFKKDFLESYATATSKVATSYNALVQDVAAKRTTGKQALAQALEASAQRDAVSYTISIQPPASPNTAIDQLSSVVTAQKSAFLQ